MSAVLAAVLLVPLAYLLGTFPSAVMVARSKGVDITTAGSGNPGASNVARVLGGKYGALVFVLDAAKGAIAAAIGLTVGGLPLAYAMIAAALFGHMYPVTRRFKGGKGIATAGGAMLVVHPIVSASLIVLWYVLSKVTKKASLASVIATIGMPIGIAIDGAPWWEIVVVILLGLVVLGRHAGNIRRLVKGEELHLDTSDTGS